MKKMYFSIEYPDGQIIDEPKVIKELRLAIEDIVPNASVSQTAPDMESFEATAEQERKDREEAKKRSDNRIKETSDEMARRVVNFSDDSLPEHVKYMPKDFREAYKRTAVAEQLAQEE